MASITIDPEEFLRRISGPVPPEKRALAAEAARLMDEEELESSVAESLHGPGSRHSVLSATSECEEGEMRHIPATSVSKVVGILVAQAMEGVTKDIRKALAEVAEVKAKYELRLSDLGRREEQLAAEMERVRRLAADYETKIEAASIDAGEASTSCLQAASHSKDAQADAKAAEAYCERAEAALESCRRIVAEAKPAAPAPIDAESRIRLATLDAETERSRLEASTDRAEDVFSAWRDRPRGITLVEEDEDDPFGRRREESDGGSDGADPWGPGTAATVPPAGGRAPSETASVESYDPFA